jgi:hypothetical protein
LFPALKLGVDEIYLLPDAALIIAKRSVAAVGYHEFIISNSKTRFIEEDAVPSDSPIVDETWRYVNKKGGPDRRFNANRKIPICIYGELSFRSDGGLNSVVQYSNLIAADRLCSVLDVLHRTTAKFPKSFVYIKVADAWPTILFVIFAALLGGAQPAFFSDALHVSLRRPTQEVTPSAVASSAVTPIVARPPELRSESNPQVANAPVPSMPLQSLGKDVGVRDKSIIVGVPLPRPRPKF